MRLIYSHCINALRSPVRLGALVALLLTSINNALAAQAQLTWDASPSPEVAGYVIHYGQEKNKYTSQIDVGKATTYAVADLTAGQTYYFAVTAYDAARVESGYSNEINRSIPESAGATELLNPTTNASTTSSTPAITTNGSVPADATAAPSSGNTSSNTGGSDTGSGGGGGGCTVSTGPADFSLPLLAGFAFLGLRRKSREILQRAKVQRRQRITK